MCFQYLYFSHFPRTCFQNQCLQTMYGGPRRSGADAGAAAVPCSSLSRRRPLHRPCPRTGIKHQAERVCCLLVLNLVSSTLSCIRQPRPRLSPEGEPERLLLLPSFSRAPSWGTELKGAAAPRPTHAYFTRTASAETATQLGEMGI